MASPHFSPWSRPASRPGVRSARSGPKSVAGTTVDARDARGRALGRDPKGGAFRPTECVKPLARCTTSRYAAFLLCRPGKRRADHDPGEKCGLGATAAATAWTTRRGPDGSIMSRATPRTRSAAKLGVSRQSAQRLVSLAVSEKLIKFRLDHPIARCMELSRQLSHRFGLQSCEIVPSDPGAPESITGVAIAGAADSGMASKDPRAIS